MDMVWYNICKHLLAKVGMTKEQSHSALKWAVNVFFIADSLNYVP